MRTFIAIPCPDELKDKILKFQNQIKNFGKIKLVERKNIHSTLKFLGDVDENKINDIIEILNSVSISNNKNNKNKNNKNNNKFKINLCGIGAFPNENYIKILWVGVSSGAEETLKLQQQIDEQLKILKFKKEKKFHPHFTIARVKFLNSKNKREIQQFLMENSDTDFGEFEVLGFELMKSELTSSGPIYSVIKKFEF